MGKGKKKKISEDDYDFRSPAKQGIGKGKPPVKHRWKKGQSGNPEGGRRHNPALRALRELTTDQYCELIKAISMESKGAVDALVADDEVSNLLGTVAECWSKARKSGDYETIEKILSRVIGKQPDKIEIDSTNRNTNLNADIPMDKVRAAMARAREKV